MTLKSYMDELRAKAEQQGLDHANASNRSPVRTEHAYKPLTEQISELMNTLPPALRNRPWTVAELALRLKGKYRSHPSAGDVGQALRALGWVNRRDWSKSGGGRRVWLAP